MVTISQLAIYPVKSLRGFQLETSLLTPQGLAYDRQWMIVNDNHRFVTQRNYAEMILIHTRIENKQLILSKPSAHKFPELIINIDQTPDSPPTDVIVWKDTCQALDEGNIASDWLAHALEITTPLKLMRMGTTPRPQSKPHLLGKGTHTFFADAAPFLVTNEESLTRLNMHLNDNEIQAVTMERFRPNIVLSGLRPFIEHQLQTLRHTHYELKLCYPCKRCVIPTIDITSGVRHPKQQPFSLLAEINPMPENLKTPAFGENAILLHGGGLDIHVGDVLEPS